MRRAWYSPELKGVRNDPRVLTFHLFCFLNINLVGKAWDIYDSVENDNGLEVWRLINLDVTQKTQAEILSLEHAVLNTKKLDKLKDIPTGRANWDTFLPGVSAEKHSMTTERLEPSRGSSQTPCVRKFCR